MNLIQIDQIQSRLTWWERAKVKWLVKHNSTFANVRDHAVIASEFRSDPERVAEYYKQRGGKDV